MYAREGGCGGMGGGGVVPDWDHGKGAVSKPICVPRPLSVHSTFAKEAVRSLKSGGNLPGSNIEKAVPPTPSSPVRITTEMEPNLCLAMQQNAIPIRLYDYE